MKTKIFALFLALVMVVGMLASCGPAAPQCDGVNHTDADSNNICDICNATINQGGGGDEDDDDDDDDDSVTIEIPDVTWSNEVELLYQMTDNSNDGELSSGCYRYLAAQEGVSGIAPSIPYADSIDMDIEERNNAAMEYAKVTVEYLYYPNTSEYNWGASISEIATTATSGTEKGRPDIFCNFVYDMMSASLSRAFKNVYSHSNKSVDVGDGERTNYFQFAKEGKYDPNFKDTGKGYMVEYMQSLSLSRDRMYLIASDYFIDLVRAFFVVPVNLTLLEQEIDVATGADAENENAYNYDWDGDGEYTVDDFYTMVRNNKWTYTTLAGFANDVYDNSNPDALEDPLDDTLGFAVGTQGGLGVSGLLYTTSITVIERKWNEKLYQDDDDNWVGDWEYWYPDENSDSCVRLQEFVTNLNSLFNSTGVRNVDSSNFDDKVENAIRARFAVNKVLFGGIICVGSLEDEAYSDMVESGSQFGVVPVPLYRGEYTDPVDHVKKTDEYLTQIHNIGRVGGIAFASTKFAHASAFLNYLSLNSTQILDDYYEWTLKEDISSGSEIEGNAEMLEYIRYHVRSSFDKAFEDAIARFYKGNNSSIDYNANKWHNIILAAKFKMDAGDMKKKYEEVVGAKDGALDKLEESYDSLP